MPLITDDDAVAHHLHGSTFTSFVAPARGSEQLCAWRLDVAAGTEGVAHRVTHEEVLLVLAGSMSVSINDVGSTAGPGDVLRVPAGATFCVGIGAEPASAWVVTSVGLQAVTADGARITPPWTT